DGYISPDWYDLGDQVPTWNYVAVHLRGVLRRLPDDRLRPHLAALSAQFERRLAPKPVWTMDKVAPEALARLERMIVPVAFTIESVDGTWKLSQNKPAAARIGAADALAQSDLGMMAAELTDLMRAAEAGEG
ncbi:MAG: FMN-binding negative transcriptional regulator, partial [Rhodospirillaceae bacterium]|nr:FMN-binding negative transcriptional regulator [Rhodospirillaceae bacterium]